MDKQRLKDENRIGLNSVRNLGSSEDLQLNFRYEGESDAEKKRSGGFGKANSDNFETYQRKAFANSNDVTTEDQTEIDRRSDNELEAMTGSFVLEATNRNIPTNEDEYFETGDESFVS